MDAGGHIPISALAVQHALDDKTRLARGDGPQQALTALGNQGPLSPSKSPMGLG